MVSLLDQAASDQEALGGGHEARTKTGTRGRARESSKNSSASLQGEVSEGSKSEGRKSLTKPHEG